MADENEKSDNRRFIESKVVNAIIVFLGAIIEIIAHHAGS